MADKTTGIRTTNTHPGRIGVLGWLRGGRHGIEGYLYALHRVSGVVLMLFLVAHVVVTSSRLLGQEAWEQVMALTHSPVAALFEYLVYAAFAFHALNGVRLIHIELGLAVGQPDEPVYPYKGSIHKQRKLMIISMVIAGLLIALGGFDLLAFTD